jgi:serine/threonine protein kinase
VKLGKEKASLRNVAIKIYAKQKIFESTQRQKNIFSEIMNLKTTSHPWIVKILDISADSINVYLILEYIDGYSLSKYI